jgi:hypothetical protein
LIAAVLIINVKITDFIRISIVLFTAIPISYSNPPILVGPPRAARHQSVWLVNTSTVPLFLDILAEVRSTAKRCGWGRNSRTVPQEAPRESSTHVSEIYQGI